MAKQHKMTASEQDGIEYRRSPMWRIALAQMSQGTSMVFYSLMTYMSYLANSGYGVVLASAGFILTATRIFDGVIDPFLALFMDRFNTKFGKIRVLMLGGWVLRSVAALLLFCWFSGKGHGAAMFIIMYLIYIVGASVCDIAGNMALPVLSNDPRQRPIIGVWGTLYSYLLPTVLTIVSTMVVLPMFGNQYTVEMLALLCKLYVAISFVLVILCCVGVSEVDKPENFQSINAAGSNELVSPKDMWSLVKGNRPFQMYIIASVSDKLASQTVSQSIVSTMLFGILIGNIQYGTMISVLGMLPAIIFAIAGAKYAGKFGAKSAMVTWMEISIAIAVACALFCTFTDMSAIPTSMGMTIAFFGFTLLFNGSKMCVTTAQTTMRNDIVDYELDRSGKMLAGTVTATYNFIDQFISSLGSTIAALGAAAVGYVTTAPQPTDPATPAIKAMTLFLYYGVPMLGYLIGLCAMKNYKLTREEMVNVQKRIAEKKAALAQEQ